MLAFLELVEGCPFGDAFLYQAFSRGHGKHGSVAGVGLEPMTSEEDEVSGLRGFFHMLFGGLRRSLGDGIACLVEYVQIFGDVGVTDY